MTDPIFNKFQFERNRGKVLGFAVQIAITVKSVKNNKLQVILGCMYYSRVMGKYSCAISIIRILSQDISQLKKQKHYPFQLS